MRFTTAVVKQPVVYDAVNNEVTVTDINFINGRVLIVKFIRRCRHLMRQRLHKRLLLLNQDNKN